MELSKLKIYVESKSEPLEFKGGPIEALFNPNQISIAKTANWNLVPSAERDVPNSQFTHGEPATLTMDLFFDTYEAGTDVRVRTGQVVALTTVNRDFHRPPVCLLSWGKFSNFFQGVLQSVSQRYSLFLPDGTPVRATLGCSFREWRSDREEALRQDKRSVDVAKLHVVKRGDTLASIAAEAYQDASLWRPIAEANRIDNPRRLTPGQRLAIPPLRPQ